MGVPKYEGNGGIFTGTDYNVIVTAPPVERYDVLIALVLDADDDTFSTPSMWTKGGEFRTEPNASFAWFWMRCSSGEDIGDVNFLSISNAGSLVAGVIARYSGCITTGNPFESPNSSGVTQSTTATINDLITHGPNRLVVGLVGVEDNTGIGEATNYTKDFEVLTAVGSDGGFSFQSQTRLSAGSVSSETCALGGNEYWGTFTFALIPAPINLSAIPNITIGTSDIDIALTRNLVTNIVTDINSTDTIDLFLTISIPTNFVGSPYADHIVWSWNSG